MKTVMSIRFPTEQHQAIIKAAELHNNSNPAELVRRAVAEHLEKLNGGGLEARIAARLEALASNLPAVVAQATADEIETRRRAALAAKHAREGGNAQ